MCCRDSRNTERGAAVVREIAASGGEAVFFPCDVTDEAQIEALFEETVRHFGRLNILAANSGIPEKKAPVHEMDVDAYRQVLETDLNGTVLCNRYSIRQMLRNEGAEKDAIVNAGSILGVVGAANSMADGGYICSLRKLLYIIEMFQKSPISRRKRL